MAVEVDDLVVTVITDAVLETLCDINDLGGGNEFLTRD
jgi:hypothetical protein